jgi:hypothetical protein
VGQGAHLFIRTFRGGMAIPGERKMYIRQPDILGERKFWIELSSSLTLAWREDGKSVLLTTDELTHEIAITYFDLISKANKGEIEIPFL